MPNQQAKNKPGENKQTAPEIVDGASLLAAYESARGLDFIADPEAPQAERLADLKLVEEYLNIYIGFLDSKDFESAVHAVRFIEDHLGFLPQLDRILWPAILKLYEAKTGEPMPTSEGMPLTVSPEKTIKKIVGTKIHAQRLAKLSFLQRLARLAHHPASTAFLTLFALSGITRSTLAQRDALLEFSGGASPSGQRSDEPDITFTDFLTEIGREPVEEISDPRANAREDIEHLAHIISEGYTMQESLIDLGNRTEFTKQEVADFLNKSIRNFPDSWGLESEPTEKILQETIQRVQERVWDAITIFTGTTREQSNKIGFQDRKVKAKKGKLFRAREHKFTTNEQRESFQHWLEQHSNDLALPSSNIANIDHFTETQGHAGPIAIAWELEDALPWGFFHASSGFRSTNHQRRIIWNKAQRSGIELDDRDMFDNEDLSAVRQQLLDLGIKVAMPGASRHQSGEAVDFVITDGTYWECFEDATVLFEAAVEESPHLSLMLVEWDNGRHGVWHVEGTADFVVAAVTASEQSEVLKTARVDETDKQEGVSKPALNKTKPPDKA